jgi:hypothetical protein
LEKAPTAFLAVANGDADAGTASGDISPTTSAVTMAANATSTRPAAGRASDRRVRLAEVVVTAGQSSSRR